MARPSTQAVTSGAASATRVAGGSFGPWTTAGGSAVTVAQGESASVLAARYGVPMEALVKANGLSSASQVTPGRSLVIPVYNAAGRQASGAAPSATAGVATAAVGAGASARGVANAPRTAASAAKVGNPPQAASTAAKTQVSRVVEPARKPDQKVAEAVVKSNQRAAEAAKTKKEVAKVDAAKAKEATKAKEVAQKPVSQPERQQTAAAPAAVVAPVVDKPEFRWPARGRIIQGFKSGAHDGIAIAVPEGTAVKAAEGGVVAYAGSELKGYGNLVLIRHTNGFVSAYAHNGELNVKRGESVKRGQTIAKSGQSGNVSAPQLHFELRKGSTPVDPTQYLAGL
ncbi:MAG: LysM peptidoglycan-binding domain-containing M23 family metallopeptidase [Beijerinckiaceae bacterium]|nr:LysM peptidoglycan-binding domain-containing M23 family metallopeptidase [Beijerinckiaceae bacterium]